MVGAGFLFKDESAKISSSSAVVFVCLTATNVKLIEILKENNKKLYLFKKDYYPIPQCHTNVTLTFVNDIMSRS